MGEKGNLLEAASDPMAMLTDMPVSVLRETPDVLKKWSDAYLAFREIQAQKAEVSAEKAALSAQQAQMAAEKAVDAINTEPAAAGPAGPAKTTES